MTLTTHAPAEGVTHAPAYYLRHDALLDELRDQLELKRWRRLTISSLARGAGCTTSTFYQHFTDLDDALAALLAREREEGRALSPRLANLAPVAADEQALAAPR